MLYIWEDRNDGSGLFQRAADRELREDQLLIIGRSYDRAGDDTERLRNLSPGLLGAHELVRWPHGETGISRNQLAIAHDGDGVARILNVGSSEASADIQAWAKSAAPVMRLPTKATIGRGMELPVAATVWLKWGPRPDVKRLVMLNTTRFHDARVSTDSDEYQGLGPTSLAWPTATQEVDALAYCGREYFRFPPGTPEPQLQAIRAGDIPKPLYDWVLYGRNELTKHGRMQDAWNRLLTRGAITLEAASRSYVEATRRFCGPPGTDDHAKRSFGAQSTAQILADSHAAFRFLEQHHP